MSPIDALSALTQTQLPGTAGALGANPLGNAIPTGQTAPVSESFNQLLSNPATQGIEHSQAVQATGGANPTTWGHMVQQMVMEVNAKQQNANVLVNDVLKGGPTPVHQAMIASEEANLSFEFLATVRNKVVDAYNQVMQMQV